ncbi:MAG: iron transporter [Alphaproteobacteria bacterium PA4]|nr:MAG: iron transporter [Alphaproteobacteria bacterium PA4]
MATRKPRRFNPFAALGPGLVTGAADDDPSGIATYSQAGAQFGYRLLWTVIFTYPFLAMFQLTCAEIARVSGRGLAANMKRSFPRAIVAGVVALLLVANILNIAADIAAMGEAATLITGGNRYVLAAGFALLALFLQVFIPYHRYVGLLKWLTLALFAYVGVVLITGVDGPALAAALLHPAWPSNAAMAMMVVALLGTTISPYLFFWQSAQELEEMGVHHSQPLRRTPARAPAEFRRLAIDSWGGMAVTLVISLCIMLGTSATLNAHGITHIDSAAQAALALRPLAGDFAFALFAIGIIGTGMLAVPVLAGSAAYALSELMGWRAGLELKPREAQGFYAIIAAAISIALALDFSGVPPILALYWSAIVNGVVAVPVMVVIMLLARRHATMGSFTVRGWHMALGWGAVLLMATASVAMFVLM